METRRSLAGHLSVLRDPTGTLTIDDIVSGDANARFRPTPSMLTEGYQKGAVWVRFSLSATVPDQWLLQVERPLIENVTLYVPDGSGGYKVGLPAKLSAEKHLKHAYQTLFHLPVSTTEQRYFLRLQSATSITTGLNIWQTEAYEKFRYSDHWIIGIVLGAIGAMLCANLLFAILLRDSLYLLYAAVLVESALMTTFHMGYASELLRFLEPSHVQLSWGIIVCLYSIVMIWFLGRLFEFRRHWIWAWRAIQAIVFLNGIALLFAAAGRYGDVALFVSQAQRAAYLFIAAFVVYLLLTRRQYQYLLSAAAFAGVLGISLVMQSQYTGTNLFGIDSSLARFMAVGTLTHLVLLSAAVAQRARQAELGLRAEKDRVIALSRAAEQNLMRKVSERTAALAESNASLRDEMERRHALELKLRQSLHSVNEALTQQRDFVGLVSHEFRRPLAVIAAVADNLSLFPTLTVKDIRGRAAKIRQAVNRMSILIDTVLASERLEADRTALAILDLNDVLRAVEASLDSNTAKRVAFSYVVPALVRGDRHLLEIVALNLIENALKYSDEGSPVTVRLSATSDFATLTVTDNGKGIAWADRERIFTKYYRGEAQTVTGFGLGLYISREIARQHGGDLELVASDGQGSTFCLTLPVAQVTPS